MSIVIETLNGLYIAAPGDRIEEDLSAISPYGLRVTHADGSVTKLADAELPEVAKIIPANPGFHLLHFYLADPADEATLQIERHAIVAWKIAHPSPYPICVEDGRNFGFSRTALIEAPNGRVYDRLFADFENLDAARGHMLELIEEQQAEAAAARLEIVPD